MDNAVWSINDEAFNYESLEELLDACDDPKAGDTVYVGEAHKPAWKDLVNVDDVLDLIESRAYDYGEDHSDSVFDKVDEAAKQALTEQLHLWMEQYLTINFYQVFHAKPVVLTDEMLDIWKNGYE